jgi:hypothetical protein
MAQLHRGFRDLDAIRPLVPHLRLLAVGEY